jgi:hypothetical protein
MKRECYFYVLRNPNTNEIKYFGRTLNPKNRLRCHIKESKGDCKSHKCNWIRSLKCDPILDVIYHEVCTIDESIKIEKTFMRKLMKRYNLTNSWDNCLGLVKVGKLVHQYSLNGEFIKTFENSNHAGIEFKIPDSNILRACKKSNENGINSAGGFLWLFEKFEKFPYKLISCNGEKPVIQLDLNDNFIKEFSSGRIASNETGISYKMISRVCKEERKHTHGYKFKFK